MSYEELNAIIEVLLKHVDDLDRGERRVSRVDSQAAIMSVTAYKVWKASLLRVIAKAREVYEEASRGSRMAASIDACELSDMVKNLIMVSSPDDPIFLGLRPSLSYLQAVATALCRPITQPTIHP